MADTPLSIVSDTGVPSGAESAHKVLVIVHGLAFQSTVFTRVLPFAKTHTTRIILINRREYPGSKPFAPDERDILRTAQEDGIPGADAAKAFWAGRADEVHALLESIIEVGNVNKNSVILVGWSLGGFYMTSLLARPPPAAGRVDVGQYLRRVICYDSGHSIYGFPYPADDMYNPFTDASTAPQEKGAAFMKYVTGYYAHDIPHTPGIQAKDVVDGFVQRDPKSNTTFTMEELASVVYQPPADVPTGGADILSFLAAHKHSLLSGNLEVALRGERWPHVELRAIWGDASFYEGCIGGIELGHLLHENKESPKGRIGRPANVVRWTGANHFAHWDHPERVLLGLLEDGIEDWAMVPS